MQGRPIFQSTYQAITFSYMVESLPVREGGTLGRQLEKMKALLTGVVDERELSSISFAGLNEMEIRGQCAMIRAAVQDLIAPPESWAIRSRFGPVHIYRGPDKEISSASFGEDRARAMRKLANYLAPNFSQLSGNAILLLIARINGETEKLRPTFRQIEQEAGSSKSTLERVEKIIKSRLRILINMGIDQLTPIFQRDGVISAD